MRTPVKTKAIIVNIDFLILLIHGCISVLETEVF